MFVLVPFGVGAVVAGVLLKRRLLTQGSSSQDAASRYVSSVILWMAFAMDPALAGFVFAFISGARWTYLISAVFSVIGAVSFLELDVSLPVDTGWTFLLPSR